MTKTASHFLGIDVGTGSARAGVFTATGKLLASASRPIQMWKPAPDHVEQSSDDIWDAIGHTARQALAESGVAPASVAGIGFDATCSLVLLDADDRPVSASTTGRSEQNVIVWMDHRAIPQSEKINATRHPVLRYVGGVISPEMQTPKLLWLKQHLPTAWKTTARFLDLPDYLTYRATGDDTRSLCTTVCKWTYLGHKGLDGKGWNTLDLPFASVPILSVVLTHRVKVALDESLVRIQGEQDASHSRIAVSGFNDHVVKDLTIMLTGIRILRGPAGDVEVGAGILEGAAGIVRTLARAAHVTVPVFDAAAVAAHRGVVALMVAPLAHLGGRKAGGVERASGIFVARANGGAGGGESGQGVLRGGEHGWRIAATVARCKFFLCSIYRIGARLYWPCGASPPCPQNAGTWSVG